MLRAPYRLRVVVLSGVAKGQAMRMMKIQVTAMDQLLVRRAYNFRAVMKYWMLQAPYLRRVVVL
jgi:hypothetical protein